ncbi:MAG: hypothetical protein HY598_03995 [Candidatus Omnitrophica bacterium]|nr:hypothetical protein [Candidatus Omnitrophota bacterium]
MTLANSRQQTADSKGRRAHLFIGAVAITAMLGCGAKPSQAEQQRPNVQFAAPKEQPVTAELMTEHASVQLPGDTRVGVLFTIKDGWHIYAQEPGDAGMPTKVTWRRAGGEIFGPLEWPPAEEFVDPGEIHTRGYRGEVLLSSRLHVTGKERVDNPLPLQAKVEWLACHDVCIPGSAELSASLPIRAEPPQRTPDADRFGPARTP